MAGEIHFGHIQIFNGIDGMAAQQADGLELVGCKPGYTPCQECAQAGPLVQKPLTSRPFSLKPNDQPHRVVFVNGIVGNPKRFAVGDRLGQLALEMKCQWTARIPEQLLAHLDHRLFFAI